MKTEAVYELARVVQEPAASISGAYLYSVGVFRELGVYKLLMKFGCD